MGQKTVELRKGNLSLTKKGIESFLERIVTPIGTSAKTDVPRRHNKRRVYVIITKKEEINSVPYSIFNN